jgi:hypothetical protein
LSTATTAPASGTGEGIRPSGDGQAGSVPDVRLSGLRPNPATAAGMTEEEQAERRPQVEELQDVLRQALKEEAVEWEEAAEFAQGVLELSAMVGAREPAWLKAVAVGEEPAFEPPAPEHDLSDDELASKREAVRHIIEPLRAHGTERAEERADAIRNGFEADPAGYDLDFARQMVERDLEKLNIDRTPYEPTLQTADGLRAEVTNHYQQGGDRGEHIPASVLEAVSDAMNAIRRDLAERGIRFENIESPTDDGREHVKRNSELHGAITRLAQNRYKVERGHKDADPEKVATARRRLNEIIEKVEELTNEELGRVPVGQQSEEEEPVEEKGNDPFDYLYEALEESREEYLPEPRRGDDYSKTQWEEDILGAHYRLPIGPAVGEAEDDWMERVTELGMPRIVPGQEDFRPTDELQNLREHFRFMLVERRRRVDGERQPIERTPSALMEAAEEEFFGRVRHLIARMNVTVKPWLYADDADLETVLRYLQDAAAGLYSFTKHLFRDVHGLSLSGTNGLGRELEAPTFHDVWNGRVTLEEAIQANEEARKEKQAQRLEQRRKSTRAKLGDLRVIWQAMREHVALEYATDHLPTVSRYVPDLASGDVRVERPGLDSGRADEAVVFVRRDDYPRGRYRFSSIAEGRRASVESLFYLVAHLRSEMEGRHDEIIESETPERTGGLWNELYDRAKGQALKAFREDVSLVPLFDLPEEEREGSEEDAAPSEWGQDVIEIPIEELRTDETRFQPRAADYSEETARRVAENFDPNLFEPIRAWQDPEDGEWYVLAGHSRLEGMRRRDAETIPVRPFEGSEEEAIRFALTENDKGDQLTNAERATYIRRLRAQGATKKEQKEEAKRLYGRDASTVVALSYLDPDGKALDVLSAFEGNATGEANDAETMAVWIGKLRRYHPELTDSHESEIWSWLEGNYKTEGKGISSFIEFREIVEDYIDRRSMFGELDGPINFAEIQPKSQQEREIDRQLQEARQQLKKDERALKKQREKYAGQDLTEEEWSRVLGDYQESVRIAQERVLEMEQKAKEGRHHLAQSEMGLFDAMRENPADLPPKWSDVKQCAIATENEAGGIELRFPSNPGEDVLEVVREAGFFFYTPAHQPAFWAAQDTDRRRALACALDKSGDFCTRENPSLGALVFIGEVERVETTAGVYAPKDGEEQDLMFTSAEGDMLLIVPERFCKEVPADAERGAAAAELFEEYHSYEAGATDYEIKIPEGPVVPAGTAQEIIYHSDKIKRPGDERGLMHQYVHEFDDGKCPAQFFGSALYIGNVDVTARGILN